MSTDSPRPRVDVVVPVYGGWEYVRPCLEALQRQTLPVRILVVDDRSPDDTADRVAAAFPDVELLRNEVNLGFARTCNVGMRHGDGDVVVLVNSDVVAEPELAEMLAEAVLGGDRTGSATPVLLAPDGTVDSFGITADRSGAGFVRFHGASPERIDAAQPPVLGPYGAVAAYRRAALDEVGMLDDNIFMYGEELDLALRLRAAGWGCAVVPRVAGTHLGGATAGRESVRQRYLSGFARGYLLRVYGVLTSRAALLALCTDTVVIAARLILRRDVVSLRGRIAGWRKGRGVARRRLPVDALDRSIGIRLSLRMRGDGYWAQR